MSREAPLEPLLDRLFDRMSVLVGQSGVGKSTLVNRLVPDALRATGDVSKVGKGRHTSSSAVLLDLPGGGDRKSTRLNSSHANISYAVFCFKKKKNIYKQDI